jgi:hypothetical protein
LSGLSRGRKAYSTLQCGPGPYDHFELNSDLLYRKPLGPPLSFKQTQNTQRYSVNHSCDPNTALDLSSPNESEWCLRAAKPIKPGDTCERLLSYYSFQALNRPSPVTFFYPSTEWEMKQLFKCNCGAHVSSFFSYMRQSPVLTLLKNCLGTIKGASVLSTEDLRSHGFINPWIWHLHGKGA